MYYDLYLFKYGMPYYNYTYGFDFYYESDKELHRENLSLIKSITINKQEFINYLMIKHIYMMHLICVILVMLKCY